LDLCLTESPPAFVSSASRLSSGTMGCGGSKSSAGQASSPAPVQAQTMPAESVAPPAGKGQGKGKGKGKGQGAANMKAVMKNHFQVKLGSNFQDYEKQEDQILKQAFLVGQKQCNFKLRGQEYEYNFQSKKQLNKGTGKEREIRCPQGMSPPKKPLLPAGPMMCVTVGKDNVKVVNGQKCMVVKDPNDPTKEIQVAVPPGAKPGTRLAVPVPAQGQTQEAVCQAQKGHYSNGAKVALAMTAIGGTAVAGVVLGEHLSGGAISTWGENLWEQVQDTSAGAWVEGAAADAGDWAGDAAADAGDWGGGAWEAAGAAGTDAGEWVDGAAASAGEWGEGAADTAGDWAEDAGEWFADVADDAGDFVMNLF